MAAPAEASATPAQRAYAIAFGVACHVMFIIGVGAMIGAMGSE
jgi:hypothetical protein